MFGSRENLKPRCAKCSKPPPNTACTGLCVGRRFIHVDSSSVVLAGTLPGWGTVPSSEKGYKSLTAHSTDQQSFLAIAQQLLGLVQVAVTCSYSNVATGM